MVVDWPTESERISDNVIRIVFEGGGPQRKIQLRWNGNTSAKGIREWQVWAESMRNNCSVQVGARE